MSITQVWETNGIKAADENGLSNVVKTVGFRADYWLDGENKAHNITGEVELDAPDSESFSEFSTLTKEQVVGWVKAKLGDEKLAEMEAEAQAYFDSFNVAQTVSVAAPWEEEATLEIPAEEF